MSPDKPSLGARDITSKDQVKTIDCDSVTWWCSAILRTPCLALWGMSLEKFSFPCVEVPTSILAHLLLEWQVDRELKENNNDDYVYHSTSICYNLGLVFHPINTTSYVTLLIYEEIVAGSNHHHPYLWTNVMQWMLNEDLASNEQLIFPIHIFLKTEGASGVD